MPDFVNTKVDDAGMRAVSNQIDTDLNSLMNSFQRISGALTDTLAPTWEDISKVLFFTQYEADSEGYIAHMQAIKLLNEQLKEAIGIYIGAEDRVSTDVNNIKVT